MSKGKIKMKKDHRGLFQGRDYGSNKLDLIPEQFQTFGRVKDHRGA